MSFGSLIVHFYTQVVHKSYPHCEYLCGQLYFTVLLFSFPFAFLSHYSHIVDKLSFLPVFPRAACPTFQHFSFGFILLFIQYIDRFFYLSLYKRLVQLPFTLQPKLLTKILYIKILYIFLFLARFPFEE